MSLGLAGSGHNTALKADRRGAIPGVAEDGSTSTPCLTLGWRAEGTLANQVGAQASQGPLMLAPSQAPSTGAGSRCHVTGPTLSSLRSFWEPGAAQGSSFSTARGYGLRISMQTET